jgi:hypothetical protein
LTEANGKFTKMPTSPPPRRRTDANDITLQVLAETGRAFRSRPAWKTPVTGHRDASCHRNFSSNRVLMDNHLPSPAPSQKVINSYLPSHSQVAGVVAECLPRHDAASFVQKMNDLKPGQANNPEQRRMRIATERSFGVIGKTPIATILQSLQCCYGSDNVEVRRLDPTEYIGHDASVATVCIRFYLLDCILDRQLRPPRREGSSKNGVRHNLTGDTPCKIKCMSESDMSTDNDYKYRAAVAIVNEASLFYCHMTDKEQTHAYPPARGNVLVPLGISWLRLIAPRGNTTPVDNLFAAGAYVRRLHKGGRPLSEPRSHSSAWLFTIFTSAERVPLKTLCAWQCPDLYGCRWPPDTFPKYPRNRENLKDNSKKARRSLYLQLLYESKTHKAGCRWHVPGALYTELSENALMISPRSTGAHDIVVRIQKSDIETLGCKSTKRRDLSVVCESIVSVRYLDPRHDNEIGSALDALTRHGETLRLQKAPCVRDKDKEEFGKMFAVGARVNPARNDCLSLYAANRKVRRQLPDAVAAMSILGMKAFPQVLTPIQGYERAAGCATPSCMQKVTCYANNAVKDRNTTLGKKNPEIVQSELQKNIVGLTLDVSLNLHNSAHYDVHDASVGFAVWTETCPRDALGWYFVIPNVYGKHPDRPQSTFEGIAIELHHGVAISWDGRRIKHCTAAGKRHLNNNIYGTFCASKSSLVKQGLSGKANTIYDSDKEEKHNDVYVPTRDASSDHVSVEGEKDPIVAQIPRKPEFVASNKRPPIGNLTADKGARKRPTNTGDSSRLILYRSTR